MNDRLFPRVSVTVSFRENGAWFETYLDLQQYHKVISTGIADDFTVYEVKMQEWISEDGEFCDCYLTYNPGQKTWRIGYDS